MSRLIVSVLAAVITVMVLLAGVALLGRPTPSADDTAWADVCLYPMNRPPGVCVDLPSRLPLP